MSIGKKKNETRQCQLQHGSEANISEQNHELITISCGFNLSLSIVVDGSVYFYQILCTFILNIYNYSIVIMISNGMKVLMVVKM